MSNFFQSWGLLIVALILGVLAILFSNLYLSNQEESLRQRILGSKGQTTDVVVATRNVSIGTAIGSENMAIATIEVEHLSKSAVLPGDFNNYKGQILKFPMSQGEPLLSHFVDGELIDRFSDLIDPGDRAVTLEIDSISSNSGLLVVGDYVDVVVSGDFETDIPGQTEEAYIPLFQKVKVLAIDRNPLLSKQQEFRYDMERSSNRNELDIDYDTVTLSIDDQEAALLAFAAEVGEIKFFLRNPNDPGDVPTDVVTNDSFDISRSSSEQQLGSYLYMSNNSPSQVIRQLETIADVVVNDDLRVKAYQRSIPVNETKPSSDFRVSQGILDSTAEADVDSDLETETQSDSQ